MPEYTVEIITEPNREALNEASRWFIIERLGEAEAGFSPDAHLGVRIREVTAEGPEEALRLAMEVFHEVTAGMDLRLRKLTVGPQDEFDED